MFIELKLKNFRQHTDRVFNFENGVVALRGANEKGKTTLLEAISYALGGATMLREPLADVVTWGQKESTLKVWLIFAINGVRYTLSRGKSGAEIRTDERIEATGQSEVTKYVETLLGCSIKTATNLMLANQQKLRGTLEEDNASMKLIEQLADFELIDRIIALIQKHRVCGTTATVEARINLLNVQLIGPVEDNTQPVRDALEIKEGALREAGELYHVKKIVYDAAQQPARDAQERLNRVAETQRQAETAKARLDSAKATFASIKPVPGPAQAKIDDLRKQYEDEGRYVRAAAAHRQLLTVPEPVWEGPYEELRTGWLQLQQAAKDANQQVATLQVIIGSKKATKITQTACGLCGKDLRNVPEVVTKNAEIDKELLQLSLQLSDAQTLHLEKDAEAKQYGVVIENGGKADRIFSTCSDFITLDRNFTPAKWTWTGPDLSVSPKSVADDLTIAVNQQQAYQRELGRQQQMQAVVDATQTTYSEAIAAHALAEAAVGDAQQVLQNAATVTNDLNTTEQTFRSAQAAVQAAERDLQEAMRILEMRKQARAQLETQLESAKLELTHMEFNNELINTLRKARPSIVEELWNIVSSSVSTYFSAIRGTPSVFMRENDSFTVDGHSIKGLSGSTLDALGLSIRMGLTKTFLPNTRILVLDEPAAAADDERETNMLAVVASSDFDQVLLVTHSDLADSFAAQVITL